MLDNRVVKKLRIMSENDEKTQIIIRHFLQVEKRASVCYTIHGL